jgi:hypothetical protein
VSRSQFGVTGDDSKLFLLLERDLALLIPSVSEFALVLIRPSFRNIGIRKVVALICSRDNGQNYRLITGAWKPSWPYRKN